MGWTDAQGLFGRLSSKFSEREGRREEPVEGSRRDEARQQLTSDQPIAS